jgi:hypothetical protein
MGEHFAPVRLGRFLESVNRPAVDGHDYVDSIRAKKESVIVAILSWLSTSRYVYDPYRSSDPQ